jgi:hypothetical protein
MKREVITKLDKYKRYMESYFTGLNERGEVNSYVGVNLFLLMNSPFFIYRLYRIFYPKPVPMHVTIVSETDDYIEKNTAIFLNSFKLQPNDRLNSNTNIEFYSKEKYQAIIKFENNLLEHEWKRRILFENTPRGNIIMYYDPYKLAFAYYCDTNSMSYRILNAVAMKYVLYFHCRHLFIDDTITLKENVSPLINILFVDKSEKTKNKETSSGIEKLNAPFAKFKKYETTSKNVTNENEKKIHIQNKFVCVGKINNFSFIQKGGSSINKMNGFRSTLLDNLSAETTLQKQVLSYKDYKLRSDN